LSRFKTIVSIILLSCFAIQASAKRTPFKKTDKGPFGTYVLYDQLPVLFPDATIKTNYSSPQNFLNKNMYGTNAYFIVGIYAGFSDKSLEALKDFIEKGNVVFISAYFLDDELEKWLGVKMNYNFYDANRKESTGIWNSDSLDYDYFNIGHGSVAFLSYDSVNTDYSVYGRDDKGRANCISIKKGSGFVVIHSEPYMFSNYHLIKKALRHIVKFFFHPYRARFLPFIGMSTPRARKIWAKQNHCVLYSASLHYEMLFVGSGRASVGSTAFI